MATTTVDARVGLARLAGWLDAHPELPVHIIEHCDDEYAEVRLDAHGHPALEAVADVAAALTDAQITVTDTPQHPPIADVAVSGWADTTDDETRLEVGASVEVLYETRADLLAQLDEPADAKSREWTTTADVLRQIAAGA